MGNFIKSLIIAAFFSWGFFQAGYPIIGIIVFFIILFWVSSKLKVYDDEQKKNNNSPGD